MKLLLLLYLLSARRRMFFMPRPPIHHMHMFGPPMGPRLVRRPPMMHGPRGPRF